MPDIWGTLPKSAIDNETIEEAIERLIAEHDEDPEAHLAAGGSLNEHKTDEVIDHPADSVVGDKIPEGEEIHVAGSFDRLDFHWFCLFESLSGFYQGTYELGSISLDPSYVELSTGATQYGYAYMLKMADISNVFTWDKKRKFKTRVYFSANSDQLFYFALGNTQNIPSTKFIGFKIDNGDIYAAVSDGSSETTEDTGINVSATTAYDFEVILTPGVDAKFYIDGVLKATISTGLPSGTVDANVFFTAFLQTMASADKIVRFSFLDFWQDTD